MKEQTKENAETWIGPNMKPLFIIGVLTIFLISWLLKNEWQRLLNDYAYLHHALIQFFEREGRAFGISEPTSSHATLRGPPGADYGLSRSPEAKDQTSISVV